MISINETNITCDDTSRTSIYNHNNFRMICNVLFKIGIVSIYCFPHLCDYSNEVKVLRGYVTEWHVS